ncbi:hypothetical protein JZ751_011646 [Albula glossodonta]|uniref:DNA-directed DNA/RNA polymerase mu n=1 Tax=Albula glossodonta TaxID=121402 RepID=A0A8T2PQ86_9TELE|nr:hypothetical protein JZ751_011646 [Albula glossodonta]
MVPLKRRKTRAGSAVSDNAEVTKFPHVVIFLLERRMGASRKTFLTGLGRRKGFRVEECYSPSVTHVVSENNSGEEVRDWLEAQASGGSGTGVSAHLLDISWFTESMATGHPVKVEPSPTVPVLTLNAYGCQRRTPLLHHNNVLTDALLVLAENAEFNEDEGRSVAFKRAVSVLKALPHTVRRMEELQGLPCLGDHSQRVIKALTGIFGVGVKTADRWFREGLRQPSDVVDTGQKLNHTQEAGIRYYEDLNTPVTRAEADAIVSDTQFTVPSRGGYALKYLRVLFEGWWTLSREACPPPAFLPVTHRFLCRGKPTGHDVDFLITHPEEGKEENLLPKVVSWLDDRGLLLYQKTTRNSYLEAKDGPARPPHNMDRFERCFSIFRLDRPHRRPEQQPQAGGGGQAQVGGTLLGQRSEESRDWKAVRVDLVVTPVSQFAFALLGWTGSQLFERELRRWAVHEKHMSLSSHALFDSTQNRYLRGSTEEEIFTHLGLEFVPPSERNA